MEAVISGDVHTPDEGEQFALTSAVAADHTATSIEQSKANLAHEGVTGPAIEFLDAMHAAVTGLAAAWRARAARFAEHIAARDEHITDDLAGTQKGRYLDPAGQHR